MKNKSLILKSIRDHYGFATDTEFADFLGIAKTTLSSWYMRGSIDYDLVYAKCVEIDGNFLLSGKGKIKRSKEGYIVEDPPMSIVAEADNPPYINPQIAIQSLNRTIKAQEITIESQKETIAALKEIISLREGLFKKGSNDPIRTT